MVDVTGIDRKELLRALWEKQKPANFFTDSGLTPPRFDASEINTTRSYIDYFCGRAIKSTIFDDNNIVDPSFYDLNAGSGMFQKIVDELRKR